MTERNEVQRIGNWMRNEYPATASTLLRFVDEFDNLLTDDMATKKELSKMKEQLVRVFHLGDIEYQKGYEEGLKEGYSNGVGSCQG